MHSSGDAAHLHRNEEEVQCLRRIMPRQGKRSGPPSFPHSSLRQDLWLAEEQDCNLSSVLRIQRPNLLRV